MAEWKRYDSLWNDFRAIRVLGEGDFGKVTLIEHQESKQQYALKQIYDKDIADRELYALEVVSDTPNCHRYVVCLHDFFIAPTLEDDNDYRSLLLQYIPGETLEDWTTRWWQEHQSVLPPAVLHPLLVSALEAVAFVHSKGVAHKDIKLNNILMPNDKDYVVLADFGQSCFVDPDAAEHLDSCQLYWSDGGKYVFSPELAEAVLNEGQGWVYHPNLMRAADVWALGTTFLEVATGKEWLEVNAAVSDHDILRAVLTRVLPDPLYSPDEHINRTLLKMMWKDPDQRWTAQGALDYLKQHAPPSVGAGAVGAIEPVAREGGKRQRRAHEDELNEDEEKQGEVTGKRQRLQEVSEPE
jgi:serine/threonine protein kinase